MFLNRVGFNYNIEKFINVIKNKKIIMIDGIIGAGKTTTIKKMNEYFNEKGIKTYPIYEPVNIWRQTGALDEFYKNISDKCYEFQTFTYITRIKNTIEEIMNHPDADYYLLERSIFTDRYIFVELLKENMGPIRMDMYNQWWDMWSLLMPIKVHKWVFLNTSLDESLNRIQKRSRFEENTISKEYQKNLYDKHIEFFNILEDNGEKTIIIPETIMDQNIPDNRQLIEKIGNMIIN